VDVPALLETKCQQFVFEYANREMAEIEIVEGDRRGP